MTQPRAAPSPDLLQGYTPRPDVADELFDRAGAMRPVWRSFISELSRLSPQEVEARFARGDQYLRDAGVYFRLYSGGPAQDRAWPFSHIPVLISDAEWTDICEGLAQRADLLEQVVADLYGPGDLVAQGHLPAELVAGNPHWCHPMVGVAPRSGHWLHHLAFEIGRSPDGTFLVLGDRTEAPSGAGFALENRMAAMRIFTDPFPRAHVRKLAGFFRTFRNTLEELAGAGRDMAILTPGPMNDTYYEHTYIARYLGLTLLEGEDLIVENGQVMVRTVQGLQPLGVLWRRIDDAFVDPLELNAASRLGTPGLIGALRQGGVSLINAPGSAVLETRAFMAFYPRIARTLMGTALKLPNIATWWCGQPRERAHVQANAQRMIIGGALETGLPFARGADAALGGRAAQSLSADWLAAQGGDLVAQQAVTLSTTPAWSDGRLVPRPMTIRVFATRTQDGWAFMPGGYARIGKSDDAKALAMQAGGSVADVWIMAERPVQPDTLVTRASFARAPEGILPARAADNLYWLGRYVDRTEGAIRLLRAYHLRLAETGDTEDPRVKLLSHYLSRLDMEPARAIPEKLPVLVEAARGAASKVRDRFSPDGWAALQDLAKTTARFAERVEPGDDAARAMSVLLRKISGFSGLVHENMYHFLGWRFLSLGRAQERADAMLMQLLAFADPDAVPGAFEIAIELGDSVMSYQRRYRFEPTRASVLDLLALDADNPRALQYQMAELRTHVSALPRADRGAGGDSGALNALDKLLLDLHTQLRIATPEALDPDRLAAFRARLSDVFDLISTQYFR